MSTRTDPRIGTELAGYRIERLLGRGGMSVVYLADDTRLGRKVALKLLAPELAEDERFRERFLRESKLAASIDHSNVIPIYEAGDADGLLFIAMRYVEGTDLKELLAEKGKLDPARTLGILGQVASALDAAHARGLVHRDVKPGNILLDAKEGDHVYLSDFGLTRRLLGLRAHRDGPVRRHPGLRRPRADRARAGRPACRRVRARLRPLRMLHRPGAVPVRLADGHALGTRPRHAATGLRRARSGVRNRDRPKIPQIATPAAAS